MIKGNLKKDFLTSDDILAMTSGGKEIYDYYLGHFSRSMKRPYGKRELKDSWGVFMSYGLWKWKDLASEESGTAIQFVQKKFNLEFGPACKKIVEDLGLQGREKKVFVKSEQEEQEKEMCRIDMFDQPFKLWHHKFWNQAEVTEEWCKKFHVGAVKSLAINRKIYQIGKEEPVFYYYSPEEKSYKIYFPYREPDFRFRNGVSGNYLWNMSNIQNCQKLIIQKSMKDLLVTSLIAPNVISTNSEGIRIFLTKEGEPTPAAVQVASTCRKPIIFWGSDPDAVRKCTEITTALSWSYVNTPNDLLPEINDSFSYVARFKLKALEQFLVEKNVL